MQNLDRFCTRCWIKSQKKMVYGWIAVEEGIEDVSFYGYLNEEEKVDDFEITDDTIIMACTGLRDKSGKLVWEGDIVLLDPQDKGSDEVVVFDNDAVYGAGFFVDGGFNTGCYLLITADMCRHWVKIGNIYENPIGDVNRSEDQGEE